jgi:hypothetical protein
LARAGASARAASTVFAAGAVLCTVLFVRALGQREIHSGLFTYGVACVAAAIGLWRGRRWGRNLGLIMAMGNLGLGTLALLSVILSRRGPVVGPIVLLVVSLVVSYWLSRPWFDDARMDR